MMRWKRPFLSFTLFLLPVAAVQADSPKSGTQKNWPSFRGTQAGGIAEGYKLPTTWDVEKKQNVLWKTPIPGLSHCSPIVWGDKLFITTAVNGSGKADLVVGLYGDIKAANDNGAQEWKVYCLHKKTGKILWERVAYKGEPKVKRHTKASHANCTMATDGKRVLAFFGSEGLYCYDLNGKLLWKKDLGLLDSGYYVIPTAQWGFASSPLLHDDMVFVQCDIQKGGFLAAFSAKNGDELWRTPRTDVPTWSTPTFCTEGGRTQIIVNGYKHSGGYEARTGKELWKLTGGGDIPVPTPVVGNGLIYLTSAHGRMYPLYAIRADATGDISLKPEEKSNAGVAWLARRNGAYMQTPLLYGDYLYSGTDGGILNCYNAKTGERVYQQRMGTGRTGFTASPVAGDGKLYFTGEEGDIFVVQPGTEFKVLAQNAMGEVCMASPAISEGKLYFRTQGHVVAIAGK